MSSPLATASVQAILDFSRVDRDFGQAVDAATQRAVTVAQNNLEGIAAAAGSAAADVADQFGDGFDTVAAAAQATQSDIDAAFADIAVNFDLTDIDRARARVAQLGQSVADARRVETEAAQRALAAERDLEQLRSGGGSAAEVAAAEGRYETALTQSAAASHNAASAADDLEAAQNDVTTALGESDNAAEDSGSAMDGLAGKLVGVAVAAAGIGTAIDTAMESMARTDMNNVLAAQLDLTAEESAQAGKIAGSLYASNYGESFEQVNEATGAVLSTLANLADDGAPAVEALAGKALTLAAVFGTDVNESVQSVNNLIRTGMVESADEGFDLLGSAMQSVPAAMREEIIPIMDEYAVTLSAAGLNGSQAMGLIVNASQDGAIAMDKAGDSVKEFMIKATDIGDTGAQEAITALGLSGTTMANDLLGGGEKAFSALNQIVTGLEGIKDPSEQAAASVAIFGTPLEDLSKNAIPGFLAQLTNGDSAIGDFTGTVDEMGATLSQGPGAALETFKRGLQDTFINVMGSTITFITEHKQLISDLGIAIGVVTGAMILLNIQQKAVAAGGLITFIKTAITSTTLWSTATGILNGIMALNPFVAIALAIGALIGVIVLAYRNSETFRNIVQSAWEGIQNAASVAWTGYLEPIFNKFMEFLGWVGEKAVWLWQTIILPAWNGIQVAIAVAWAVIQVVFDIFMAGIRLLGDIVMFLWHNVIEPAFNGIKFAIEVWWFAVQVIFELWKIGVNALVDVVLWFWHNAIEPAFNAIGAVISFVWNSIILPVFNFWRAGVQLLIDIVMFLWQNAVMPAFDAIGAIISFTWNSIIMPAIDGFKAALSAVGDVASWLYDHAILPAFNGIRDAISGVLNFLSPLWDSFKSALSSVGDVASSVGSGMRSAFDGVVGVIKAPIHAIGSLLSSIPDKLFGIEIPGAGAIKGWGQTLQNLATGGVAAGRKSNGLLFGPGSGTSDSIFGVDGNGVPIARLSAGEFVTPEHAVNAQTLPILEALRRGWVPSDETLAIMFGGIPKVGDLGSQENADRLLGLPGYVGGGIVTASDLVNFAKGVEGKPYDWGGVNWGDCSGAISALANYATGREAFASRFATMTEEGELASRGFLPGLGPAGSLNVGWFNGGPYGGHTAATLPDGTNFEMGGARGDGQFGGGAAGANDPSFTDHAHLPPDFFAGGDLNSPTFGDTSFSGTGGGGFSGGGSGGSGGSGTSGGSGGSGGSSVSSPSAGSTVVFVENWPGTLSSSAGSQLSQTASSAVPPSSATDPAAKGTYEDLPLGTERANAWAAEQNFGQQFSDWQFDATKSIVGEILDPLGLSGAATKQMDADRANAAENLKQQQEALAANGQVGGDVKLADTVTINGVDFDTALRGLSDEWNNRMAPVTGRFRNG